MLELFLNMFKKALTTAYYSLLGIALGYIILSLLFRYYTII